MTGWIIVGFFAAFGILSAGLTLAGMLFFFCCRGTGGCMILTEQEHPFARYYRWLSAMGILKCRFLTVRSSDALRWLEEQNAERTGGENEPQPYDRSCET